MTFRAAMAQLATPVTVVTAYDPNGWPRGFTANAVSSVSLSPPLVLVCVGQANSSHNAFVRAGRFAINILRDEHENIAVRLASRVDDRFAGGDFVPHPDAPLLRDALAVLTCSRYGAYPAGDHTILVGQVHRAETSDGRPLLYFQRNFQHLDLVSAGPR